MTAEKQKCINGIIAEVRKHAENNGMNHIDTLRNLFHLRGRKFNILVVGQEGVGKTTTITTLFPDLQKQDTDNESGTEVYTGENVEVYEAHDDEAIRELLQKKDADGKDFIDSVLVICYGDMPTENKEYRESFRLLSKVVAPMLGKNKYRLSVAINCKGRWGTETYYTKREDVTWDTVWRYYNNNYLDTNAPLHPYVQTASIIKDFLAVTFDTEILHHSYRADSKGYSTRGDSSCTAYADILCDILYQDVEEDSEAPSTEIKEY